jgi:long-subunit fatty acid transport protein
VRVPGRVAALVLALVAAAVAVRARADGGYFSGTTGARAAGRAGAFTARADDLSAVMLNPAGIARLQSTLLHGGNRFSYNAHSFTRRPTLDWGAPDNGVPPYVEFAEVDNDAPWQLLEPLLGAASNLGLPDWGFALTVHAPAGVGRQEFPVDGGQRYMMVSRQAVILDYAASAAWKSGERFGVGASVQWIHVPRLRYQLVIDANPFPREVNPVASELDMLATVTGSDPFTLNAIVGAWWRPVPFLELAISGQVIPTEIETASTLAIDPLSPVIDEQVVLRRDGERASDVTLTLPLPISARAGVRYRQLQGERELFDVELDVSYESWSRVERFTVDGNGLVANLLAQRVDVDRIVIDKQWRDTLGVHLGGDYGVLPNALTLRAGLFYESAVAGRSHAHVDFASGAQLGGALGLSVFVLGLELAVAYQYRHQPALSVSEAQARVFQEVPGSQCQAPFTDPDACHPQYLGVPAPPVNAGRYRAHSHVTSLDVLHRF